MAFFFKLLGWHARKFTVTASASAIAFAVCGSFLSVKLLHHQQQKEAIPLFDAKDVVHMEEHARYPCGTFTGYSVVVWNYYTRIPDDGFSSNRDVGHEMWGLGKAFTRLLALFSNETHTVVDSGDPVAYENQLHLVREVVGGSHAPGSMADPFTSTTSAPFIASSTWPEGTAKYSAMTIEPSLSSSSLSSSSSVSESLRTLRWMADKATHQSFIRCDPFASPAMNCAGDASYLGAPYLRVMLSAFLLLPSPFSKLRVAVLGVGGGSLPSFLQRYFSRDMVRLDLVDAEPMCYRAAVEDLGMRETLRGGVVACHVRDGAGFLKDVAAMSSGSNIVNHAGTTMFDDIDTASIRGQPHANCYDVVFVDLFVGSEPPSFLSSVPFIQLCYGSLSSIGVAAFNLPMPDPVFLDNCHRVFGRNNVFELPVPESANVVVLARRAGGGRGIYDGVHIARRHLYRRAKALQKSHALPYDLAGHYPVWWRVW